MPGISKYAPVEQHERKENPHPQYARTADLQPLIARFATTGRGQKGEKGDKGDKGDQGEQGEPGVGGTAPTGTGFRHVTGGTEDAASKLVENADVHAAAAIAESKLALNFATHSNALDHANANDPSAGEKAALAGTSGTPGGGNKYVTDGDARNTNSRTPSAHTHPESDITNLVSDLAGKAASVHTHAQSDVTNLVSDLAGKAASSHTHAQSEVTNLVSDLAAKAPTARNVATQHSLTGGGDLSADRTLNLVNDSASPGNNMVYGTTGAGTKGWKSDPAAVVNIKQTEVDFGATPVQEASFTIVDADVGPTSQLIGNVAYEAPTGKDLDEVEMDAIDLKFGPGSGQFSLYARALDGYIADKFKINYLIG
jgi:hypothetical protein